MSTEKGVSSGTGGTGGDGKSEDKGGNRRGGGKRTPGGKTTKLPACCLPNNMMNTFYIGGGNGVALVEGALLNLGWKRTTDKYDERFKLKWVECKSRINYQSFREGDQLVNHIPNCHLLTNKMGLLNSLQEYERVTLSTKGRPPRLKMVDIVPETYKLDDKNDRETFLEQYKDGEMWICKPTGMNQGKGIFLLRSKEEIDKLLSEREEKQQQQRKSTRPLMSRIVQRYIHNPLLLDGRKFDIRAYMLIASTTPFLVVYHKGYVRLSCMPYNGEDTNLTTHLTNQYIQKKDPNYQEVKEDTAWSMDKFNDYINEKVAPEKNLEPDFVYNYLTKQMQRVMLHCFNSVKHKLQSKMGYFDLYGLDFMIDTDMKVWMIEINVNPSLSTNCEALREVIPSVVEESINVSIECFEKSRKNQALMPLNSLKGFTVLYCGSQPNAVQSRQPRSISPAKDTPEKNPKVTQVSPNKRTVSPSRSFIPRTNATHNMPPIQSKSGTVNTEAELFAKSPYSHAITHPKPVNFQNKMTHPKPVNKPATTVKTATAPQNDPTKSSKSPLKSTPPSITPPKSTPLSNTSPKSTPPSNTSPKSTPPSNTTPKSTPSNSPPKSTTPSSTPPKSTTPLTIPSKSSSQGSSPTGDEVKLKMVHKNSVKLKTDAVTNDRGN
ncbi:protein polyglycylase TTLL10 isoform X2 [Patella vulgata]|uniref:protein polyglycylase TTLL10 isoform X2 n=1 Tax=Patella vulgata TaxID=6465 RepID=UPI0024A89D02|nr:protein polyglycylase TTLL10 isoform X2 [Patella vulgata]